MQPGLELAGGIRQTEGLQPGRVALRVLAQQHEVAGVGHQHQPVALPVPADLGAFGGEPGVVVSRLDLHHAAVGQLSLPGAALLHLPSGKETDVGVSRALLSQFNDAEYLGAQGGSY